MRKKNSGFNVIKLTPSQSAWLKMIAPANAHARYNELRVKSGLDALSKKKDYAYSNFIHHGSPLAYNLAELVFQAHGVTTDVVLAIETLGLRFGGAKRTTDSDDLFFKECSDILWRGEDPSCNEALLLLMDSTLYHKGKLTDEQQRIVLGHLLDYLLETRDYKRWNKWMIAASFESNTNALSYLRSDRDAEWEFPQCIINRKAGDCDEIDVNSLTREQLDACGFFVRRFNMRINEIRHQNYEEQRKFFDGTDRTGFIYNEGLRRKSLHLLRGCFKWAREKIIPFWERMIEIKNPNRWYFLVCGARLIYDWAIWNYFSVKDKDSRESCKVFRTIFGLASIASVELAIRLPECGDESPDADRVRYKEELELKCRLHYLASVACRHLAESVSRGVWKDESEDYGARYFALQAAEQAKQAHFLWNEYWENGDRDNGVYQALKYRFSRNHARQLTFLARWWLMHPTSNGQKPRMHAKIPEYFGVDTLEEASAYFRDSICASRGMHKISASRLVLEGKPLLEYEFYLRTWIEQLVFFFHVKVNEINNNGNGEDPEQWAMTCFCQIMLIYIHLFIEAQSVDLDPVLKMDPTYKGRYLELKNKVKCWLKRYKCIDSPFDEIELDGTMQKNPPSIIESRFETICAIKYEAATRDKLKMSALWRVLTDIEAKVNSGQTHKKTEREFVTEIWLMARSYIDDDINQTIGRIGEKTRAYFENYNLTKGNSSNEKLINCKECWKQYPPFEVRKLLVFEPGSNPDYIDPLMVENGLDWRCVKEYYSAIQEEEDR